MKNESVAYVIGLSPIDLLTVEFQNMISSSFNHIISCVSKVRFGTWKLEEATIFQNADEAVKVKNEIKDNYDSIYVKNFYIVDSIAGNDDFNPDDLHVYEIKYFVNKVIE